MKLINGDCLAEMTKIADKSVDMVLCDLPYGTTRNKWDVVIPMDEVWAQYARIIKDNGAIVLFADGMFMANLMVTAPPKLWRYNLVWEKEQATDFLNANVKPMKIHEEILVFYKKKPTYNPQLANGKPYKKRGLNISQITTPSYGEHKTMPINNHGTRKPTTILRFNHDSKRLHPTQKPIPLLEWLIKTYTNEGEIVLDNCMGSGSTGVACKNTNRRFIGIEKDVKYFEIAKNRIEG